MHKFRPYVTTGNRMTTSMHTFDAVRSSIESRHGLRGALRQDGLGRLPGLEALAQHLLVQLADTGLRDLVHEDDLVRQPELRHLGTQEVEQLGGGQAVAV